MMISAISALSPAKTTLNVKNATAARYDHARIVAFFAQVGI